MKSFFYKNKLDIGVTRVLFIQWKPTLQTADYYGRYPLSLGKPPTVSLNLIR